ncbi:(d)CMP kinase [Paenibacillus senegalensis]|uniref:(d)CMP kinase n=1 Tax=Paenibacillus senegalensis TaxID=1465766 RepID=UPI000287D603|nr:(d)CMP kinase [Paenibacillus senegalensis]
MDKINVALDGPAGAGKSTVARMVAHKLGYIYVDTGAMYRAVTWKALQSGLDITDESSVRDCVERMHLVLHPGETGQQVIVDGENITTFIRSSEVNQAVSQISQIPSVRQRLVQMQKQMAANKGVVMDGRDIGTSVLPDAEVKVFLTANPRVRAERRYAELEQPEMTLEELEEEIKRRDDIDRNREVSPLREAEDAYHLDSSEMSLQEVVDAVLELCMDRVGGGAE